MKSMEAGSSVILFVFLLTSTMEQVLGASTINGTSGEKCTDTETCSVHGSCIIDSQFNFHCECDPGFTGNGTNCKDIDECQNSLCNAKHSVCNNTVGSYKCDCLHGYRLDDKANCLDVNECEEFSPCKVEGSTCMNLDGGYRCDCPPGYESDAVEGCRDLREKCPDDDHRCSLNGECVIENLKFQCECSTGFRGNGYECEEGFPCLDPSLTCSLNGRCEFNAGLGKFHCTCKPGFTGDGSTCADIDECRTGQANCDVHAMCTNTVGSFNCNCVDGYKGDGHLCQTKGKPCPGDNFTCTENAQCIFEDKFKCVCKHGYVGNGQTCEDVDECKEKKDNCHYRAVCTNTVGSFKCSCLFGTLGDGITCV